MPVKQVSQLKPKGGAAMTPNARMVQSLERARAPLLKRITLLNKQLRVGKEKIRADGRRAECTKLRAMPSHVVGARKLYEGHCLACIYRAAGWAGGKAHDPRRCTTTKTFLGTPGGKRWLGKRIAAKAAKKAGIAPTPIADGGRRAVLKSYAPGSDQPKGPGGMTTTPAEEAVVSQQERRARLMIQVARINTKMRIYREKARTEDRRLKRSQMQGTPGHVVGARRQYDDHCLACVYRAAGWAGGSAHDPARCEGTKAFLTTPGGKRWLKKKQAARAAKHAAKEGTAVV